MGKVTLMPYATLCGKDRFPLWDRRTPEPDGGWRGLTASERAGLKANGNSASDWDSVLVSGDLDVSLFENNRFAGMVRIGRMSGGVLRAGDLELPVGISGSFIDSCDIGDDCAIHDVRRMCNYVTGARCMLFNVAELVCTGDSLDGVEIAVMNESGGRSVAPFEGITTADAYLWAKYVDDKPLQECLREMTRAHNTRRAGCRSAVGEGSVLRDAGVILDSEIGPGCYIHGVARIERTSVMSTEEEPVEVGENAFLYGGVVGCGSEIGVNCIAERFVLGSNCRMKYGVRVIDTVIGDNSTVACCEMLNNLVFPAHEQHHNNSFLIASCIAGQSNLAAGATVGSNHNSRTADNELVAGRGFWPGLCVSLKHSSVFASYTLIAKGDYPSELYIPLPFSLVSNNVREDELDVMPAFWWMHNMYALARNGWKYHARDRRRNPVQNIEFDTFAPDTMEEVLHAMSLLEEWYGPGISSDSPETGDAAPVFGKGMEKGRRKVRILKPVSAYRAYGEMILHYSVTTMLEYLESHPETAVSALAGESGDCRDRRWINLGGQLVREADADELRTDMREGRIGGWEEVHARYAVLMSRYPEDRLRHACRALCVLKGRDVLTVQDMEAAFMEEKRIQELVRDRVKSSRCKDYMNPFRRATCRNEAEMIAATGPMEEDSFIRKMEEDAARNIGRLDKLLTRIR